MHVFVISGIKFLTCAILFVLVNQSSSFMLINLEKGRYGVGNTKLDALKVNKQMSESITKSFFIETHGCQMNIADSDIVRSILLSEGYNRTETAEEAQLILINTCAIRENAEEKVWQRIKYFQSIKKKMKLRGSKGVQVYPIIGVLGCMAENLKSELMADSGIDFIAGPDSYRQLPELIKTSTTDQRAANIQLSFDETYTDIQPVRLAEGNTHAFVTITRGCDNHCAFCIVPYTRYSAQQSTIEVFLTITMH